MKKITIVLFILTIFTVSTFAGVGFELGFIPIANAIDIGLRAGLQGGVNYSSKDSKLMINIITINALGPIETDIDELMMNGTCGIMYSFVEPIYVGARIGIVGCPDGSFDPDPQLYNSFVLRAQKYKKGLSYYAETEFSIASNNNKFSVGINYRF